MDIVERIVAKRKPILNMCARHGADNVRIFGSCARSDYDENSDIDVLIHFKKAANFSQYLEMLDSLKSDLEQLLNAKVDIVDEGALRGRTKAMILEEAVPL